MTLRRNDTGLVGPWPVVALLGRHPLAEISSVDGAGWDELVEMSRELGSSGYAIPLVVARQHDAYLLARAR